MRTWIIVACVSCAAGSNGLAWSPQSGQAGSGPKISVDTTAWNFGEVWAGEKLEKSVVIKNVGDAPLEIQKPKSSCGCTVPSEPKSPLMPGESTTMLIKYNGVKLGDAHQTVTLNSNDSAQPSLGIGVQGKIKPHECPAFGTRCTPEHPLGATMVSSEGACAAYYRYRREPDRVVAR